MAILKSLSPLKATLLFFVLILGIQILLVPVPRADHHLLSGDGAYYFSYLRSLLFDFDFALSNEILIYNGPISDPAHQMGPESHITYAYAIGSSLLWLPFFIFAQGISLGLFYFGFPIPIHGYSYFNEFIVSVASILYGCLGLLFTYKLSLKYFKNAYRMALAGYLGSSSVIYYFIFEPSLSHLNSLFVCALFLFYIENLIDKESEVKHAFFLGIIMGLMILVRWQNAVFALYLLRLYPQFRPLTMEGLRKLGAGGSSFFMVCSLQFIFWKLTHGKYFLIPQGEGFVDWLSPQVFDILFTTQHGLISWTPMAGFAILGLGLWVYKTRSTQAILCLSLMLINIYINASIVGDIGGGAAFGMRRFINCFPLFVFGLAALLEQINKTRLMTYIIGVFIVWNSLFIVQYRLGFIDPIAPLSWHEMIDGKWEMLPHIYGKIKKRVFP